MTTAARSRPSLMRVGKLVRACAAGCLRATLFLVLYRLRLNTDAYREGADRQTPRGPHCIPRRSFRCIGLDERSHSNSHTAEAVDVDQGDDNDDDGVRRKHTFLDKVLGQPADDSETTATLSDEEILNEVRTLIAVQQTSASTLSFVAVCLALNADVQRRAREEVLRVDAEAAAADLAPLEQLNRLKYVERVIKETLRLYPITAIFSRTLSEDLVLEDAPTLNG